jgi:aspartyl-tRNA(Asn)/glutamyl-tRNA(Gln) amidotransferase subunit A
MSKPISHMSLTEVAGEIAGGHLSSLEATEACLSRIEEIAPKLNCIADIDKEAARLQARKADDVRSRAGVTGPLHGVPLAHKDMYYRKGRISGCGSKIRADFVPDHTSSALSKLDDAGALDIARLNMVEFALGVTGHNDVMPTPRNPWNTEHFTGGSSSGSGSAVAARLVYGALGSDTGGSIRLPSACCGLVGMKPTLGRVSRYGAMPLSHSLDTVGPLTRTIKDNALILQTIAGSDDRDPTTSPLPVPDYLDGIEGCVKGLRIGVPNTHFYDGINANVETLVRASLDVYEAQGAEIIFLDLPASIGATNSMTGLITAVEGSTLHFEWLRDRYEEYGSQTRTRFSMGLMTPATVYHQAISMRVKILDDFAKAVFDKVDVLHTPMINMPVPKYSPSDSIADQTFLNLIAQIGHCTRPINYLGLPGLNVPCGFADNGLPCSFQLVGRPFDEKTLYRTGYAYERETDWVERAPDI